MSTYHKLVSLRAGEPKSDFALADGMLVELFEPADNYHAYFATDQVLGDDCDTR